MARKLAYYTLIPLLLLAASAEIQAKHLVGGSLSYSYIGYNNGRYAYTISLEMYRDCNQNVNFSNSVEIGFYDRGTNSRDTTISLPFNGETPVKPPKATRCNYTANTCLDKTVYTGVVYLPASSFGYNVFLYQCCRNILVNNLASAQNQGETYYAVIPPTSIVNSSPYFSSVPSPYICAFDTTTIINLAVDPDGDSLAYRLAWPYSGQDSIQGNGSSPPTTFKAPEQAAFYSGYGFLNPFGTGGYAKIDPLTGLTTLFAPNAGYFVIAYDVMEFRNGQLLSKTRRDLEIIVINCPANPPPERLPVSGGGINNLQTVFNMNAGDSLGFNMAYNNWANDSITLTYSGDMFSATPPARLDSFPVFQQTQIIDSFSWHTTCLQARKQPYILVVTVTNNGCPPKQLFQTYSVYVNPYQTNIRITGPEVACYSKSGSQYQLSNISGTNAAFHLFNALAWSLSADSSTLTVMWDTLYSSGMISISTSNKNGCAGDTAFKNISIYPPPAPPPISGNQAVCINSSAEYTISPHPGSKYYWLADGGTLLWTNNYSSVKVLWASPDTGTLKVVEVTSLGCLGDTFYLPILIKHNQNPILVQGDVNPCGNTPGYVYTGSGSPGSSYLWQINGGAITSDPTQSQVTVTWLRTGMQSITATELDPRGCDGLPNTLEVNVHDPAIEMIVASCQKTENNAINIQWQVQNAVPGR